MVEHQLANTSRRIDRIVDAIADGTASDALKAKLADLEAEKERLDAERQGLNAPSDVADLHPNLPEVYRRRVAELEVTLRCCPAERAAAGQILRPLIDGIVVHPGERRGETQIEVAGSIVAILDMAYRSPGEQTRTRSVGMVVPRGGASHFNEINTLIFGGTTRLPVASLCFSERVSHRAVLR